MSGFIFFIIFAAIVVNIINSAKKFTSEMRNDSDDADDREMRQILNRTVQRRMSNSQGQSAQPGQAQRTPVREGESTYTHQPLHETVVVHSPTVHTDETDCEAHKKPVSTEGSSIRAHEATAHSKQEACEAHEKPVSTEGESREQRLERLRRKKAELDAKKAFNERYDENEVLKPATSEVSVISPEMLRFDKKAVVQAMLYSEILSKPKARR